MDIDEDLIKEVYARFGLAYYLSECLHREVANDHALLSFSHPTHVTRPRLEEKLAHAFSMTLGQLIAELGTLLPKDLTQKLDDAVQKRNFLAHHYWYERSHLMVSNKGLDRMAEELADFAGIFQDVDRELTAYCRPRAAGMGITEEHLAEALAEALSGTPPEPLPSRPIPRKSHKVQIVRAWDIPSGTSGSGLVFESADGQLWQLCDVGLGWFLRDEPESHWKVNSDLAPYLPAVVPARPDIRSPWDFDLPLERGAILQVRPPREGRVFRWSIMRKVAPNPGPQADA